MDFTISKIKQVFNEFFLNDNSVDIERPARPSRSDLKYKRGGRSQRSRNLQIYRTDLRKWKINVLKGRAFLAENEVDIELTAKVKELGDYYLNREYKGSCEKISFASDRPGIGTHTKKRRILKYSIMLGGSVHWVFGGWG